MTAAAYNRYLAITHLEQRLERFGITVENIHLDFNTKSYKDQDSIDSYLERDEIPLYWKFPEVRASIPYDYFPSKLPEDFRGYYWEMDEEKQAQREELLQKLREEFIMKFVETFPNVVMIREGGKASLYWPAGNQMGINLEVGQAMCERVLVREEYEEVPDPEALEEAMKDIPKVKKVKPVYEWRCNDAELTTKV